MIHNLKEEVYISIYLIFFGLYLASTYDATIYVLNKSKLNKITKIFIQIIFCLIQITITYFFSYKLAYGYIPIYFIIFVISGVVLYKIACKRYLNLLITKLLELLKKLNIKKYFRSLFYSQELLSLVMNKIKRIKLKKKNKIKKEETD